MWIKGAPTEPGNYWVVYSDTDPPAPEPDPKIPPRIVKIYPSGTCPGGLFAATLDGHFKPILNFGRSTSSRRDEIWIFAHQLVAEPEAYVR